MAMESWNRKFMPRVDSVPERQGEVPGIPTEVLQYPAQPATAVIAGVRRARLDDLAQCVELINATHEGRDLFRAYTLPSLLDRLDAGLAEGLRSAIERPYGLDDFYVVERGGKIIACGGLWDRGRDQWERWHHRESNDERVIAVTALLDYGVARGAEDALAALVDHFIGVTHKLGRDFVVAPLDAVPDVVALLESRAPIAETRYLQWRAETPRLNTPIHIDLVYW